MRYLPVATVSAMSPLFFATASWSANLAIVNPGFEANPIPAGTFQVVQPTGWTTYDPGLIINNLNNAVGLIYPDNQTTFFPGGAPEGNNAALIYLAGPVNSPVGIEQTLVNTFLQANTRYTLTVQVGNIASGISAPGSSGGGGVFFNLNGFPGYRIELLAGGTVIASDNTSAGTIPEGEFRLATLIFDTDANVVPGQLLGIRLINLDEPGTVDAPNIEVNFDDVALTANPLNSTSVPEPSAAGALLALFAGMFGFGRRAKN